MLEQLTVTNGVLIAGNALLGLLILGLLVRKAVLKRRIKAAWREFPRDAATGLFERKVCLPRLGAEFKRAQRNDTNVYVGVITVLSGDADRFGRMLQDTLRVPEIAFRLSGKVFCLIRPDITDDEHAHLIGRIDASGPREELAIGEVIWDRTDSRDAGEALLAASQSMREAEA